MASPAVMFALPDWSQIWRESRGEIIGGIVVAIILGLAAIIWRAIRRGARDVADPQSSPIQAARPDVVVNPEDIRPPEQQKSIVVSAAPKSSIPRPPITGFVARRDESGRDIVERLKTELSPDKEQLIVLWGAGGVGKTTLAAETVRAMRNVFTSGIIWTTADGRPDFELSTLLDEIANHLNRPELRQLAPGPKEEEVQQALAKTPATLIVLDNFETIAPNEQKRCAEWLANRASCPALITSRDEVPAARPVHILAMSFEEARDFLGRLLADARNPHAFDHLDHEKILLAADRIPLVLQWVVKQIDSARQPQVVLDELLHGEGDAAKRVFDRSFELTQVGDDGRAALLALSLFVPSASRPALAQVAGFANGREQLEPVVQQLAELRLIKTTDGNERLQVDGLTRELARARLEKGNNATEYRQKFVTYFLEFTAAHHDQKPESYDLLEMEKGNLLNAMDVAFELSDWEGVVTLGYRIALPVTGVLSVRGYWADAVRANQQALEAARRSNSQLEIADFAHNLAVMYQERLENDEARQLLMQSLEIMKNLGDRGGVGLRLHELARLAHREADIQRARELYQDSLEIFNELEDKPRVAASLHQLAVLAQDEKKHEEARRLYEESLDLKRQLDDERGIASSLFQMAKLSFEQGNLDEARKLSTNSLNIAKRLGHQWGTALNLHLLGSIAEEDGNNIEAERLYAEAFDIFERLKSPSAKNLRSALERVRTGKVPRL